MVHLKPLIFTIAIDTEEDDWGSYAATGQSVRNIVHLRELQHLFDRHGARPTYLVNRPPLRDATSMEVLGPLAAHPDVEIGAHCHPWNTPPDTGASVDRSMMCVLPREANAAKIHEVTSLIERELGIRPRTFRAGRWGFGTTVALALADQGYQIDCSVTPFVDWTGYGGPDFSQAPPRPYRFHPAKPLEPTSDGSMLQLPTTVAFLGGHSVARQAIRYRLEQSPLARLKVVGLMDRAGLFARRWLSPENSTVAEMVRVVEAVQRDGGGYVSLTFHSCTFLPGATPFVRDEDDRTRFLRRLDDILGFAASSGFTFMTQLEAARTLEPDLITQ